MDRVDIECLIILAICLTAGFVVVGTATLEITKNFEEYVFEITATDNKLVTFRVKYGDQYMTLPYRLSLFCESNAQHWIRFKETVNENGTIKELLLSEQFYFSADSIIANGGYAFISLTYQNVTITLTEGAKQ